MGSIKKKLTGAVELDNTITDVKIHQLNKAMNTTHTFPTYSVSGVFSLELTPNCDKIAMGYGNGDVEVFSTSDGRHLKLIPNVCRNLPVTSLKFLPDGETLYATGPNGKVTQINTVQGSTSTVITQEDNEISCIDLNADNTYIAVVGKNPDVYIYDRSTYELVTVFEGPRGIADALDLSEDEFIGHSQRLFVTKFDPVDKNSVLSAGWDCNVKMWDVRSNTVSCNITGPKVCGEAVDISGNYILTGSWVPKDALQIWDIRTAKLVTSLNCKTHEDAEFLYCAQFGSADRVLCGGSGIKDLRLINVKENEVIDSVSTNLKVMQCMALSRQHKQTAVAGLGEQATMIALT